MLCFERSMRLAFVSVLASALWATEVKAQDEQLEMATVDADSQSAKMMTTFAQIASGNAEGVSINVYADGIDTLDTMTLSRGVLDMSMVSPVTHDLMTVSGEMFASETVMAELSKAVQLIMWFPQGTFHFAVRTDSGIVTLDDIAGATIYLGPHIQSGAYYDAQSWIAATTGLIAEQDYVPIADTWAAGADAFLSGDIDVFVSACLDPCHRLAKLSGLAGIRMIAPSNADNAEVEQFFQAGRSEASILSILQDGERSGSSTMSFQTVAGIAVYDATDTQLVYDLTKAYWENLDQIPAHLFWTQTKDISFAARQRGLIQFHPGTARYYSEAGAH